MFKILKKMISRFLYKNENNPQLKPPSLDELVLEPLPHQQFLLAHLETKADLMIFDIGACDCLDSVRYSRLFPNATVYAFEPLPQNVIEGQRLLNLHHAASVSIVPVAVGRLSGASTLYVSSGKPTGYIATEDWNFGNKSSSLLVPDTQQIRAQWSWLRFSQKITVPVITLDHFCAERSIQRIDLAHVDVQGGELDVLVGASSVLHQISILWIELSSERFYQGQPVAAEVEEFLIQRGFIRKLRHGTPPQWDELWINQCLAGTV